MNSWKQKSFKSFKWRINNFINARIVLKNIVKGYCFSGKFCEWFCKIYIKYKITHKKQPVCIFY